MNAQQQQYPAPPPQYPMAPPPAPAVTPPQPAGDSRGKPAAVALFVISGLMLIGLVSSSWFTMGRHGIGLFDAFGHRVPADVMLAALLALAGGLTAVGLQIHGGAMLMNGNAQRAKVTGINVAIGISLAGSLLFVIRVLGEAHGGSFGWSSIVTLIALVAGLVVSLSMVRPLANAPMPAGFPVMGGAAPAGAQSDAAKPYPIVLQDGMTRYYGHFFLRANRIFFICEKSGGAWMQALGAGLGGALGAVLSEAASHQISGGLGHGLDDETLMRAVQQMPGSLIMEANQITEIKQNMWWRLIRWNGKRFGLPRGLGRDLKPAIGAWARYHGVKTVGF